jgi:hypothetical protein
MPVEFIGMIATQEASEVLPLQGPPIDVSQPRRDHPCFTVLRSKLPAELGLVEEAAA